MIEKEFPFPGEVLSENHQFRTSKPPIHDSREENEEASKVLLKTLSLRIENSEPTHPLVTNSQFSQGEEREARSSKMLQKAASENREF